jgi:serine/threonine-protein kinase
MEFLEGETLDRYLEREKIIDWRRAADIGIQACRALEAAHDAGVFHRDIKPANLFLTRSQTVKLLDFGVAKAQDELDGVMEGESNGSASPPICIIGTPDYMAPEQASGKASDARSDIYALGAVLYELVTGRPPHCASSAVAVLNAKLQRDPEPPRLRAPIRKLPLMVDHAIQRSLQRHPECRYRSAADLRKALEEALAEPDRIRARRRRIAATSISMLSAGAALLAVLGLGTPRIVAEAVLRSEPLITRLVSLAASRDGAEQLEHESAAVARSAPSPAAEATVPDEPNDTDDIGPGSDVANSMVVELDGTAAPSSTEPIRQHAVAEPRNEGADAASEAASEDPVAEELARLEALLKKGRETTALSELRQLGQVHDRDPRVLKVWSQAAIRTRAWGEALRVTEQWARLDSSSESQLQLARMLRAAGHHEQVIETLTRLLDQDPDCEEARTMLRAHTRGAPTALGS